MRKKNGLNIVFVIAGALFFACILVLICFNGWFFNKSSFSTDIRNVVLSVLAIASIPFLIYNYINKQNDIDIKRDDQVFKVESSVADKIYELMDSSLTNYKSQLLKIDFGNPKYDSSPYIWMDSMLYDRTNRNGMSFDNHSLSCVVSKDEWIIIKQEVSSICGLLKSAKSLRNREFYQLILYKFSSSLSSLEIGVLYYITLIVEIDNHEEIFSLKLEVLSDVIEDLLDLDLIPESIESKIKRIEKCSEFFNSVQNRKRV